MNIVHLSTSDLQGGAAQAAYRLHRGLLGIGEQSRMLVRHKQSTDSSVIGIPPRIQMDELGEDLNFAAAIQNHYINSHRTPISGTIFSFPYPGYDLSACPSVKDADILNLHWVAYYQSPVTLRSLFVLGKPVVWTLHDQWPFTGGCHYSAGCEHYQDSCEDCPQLTVDPFDLPQAVLRDKLTLFEGANLSIVAPSTWLGTCARHSRLFKDLRVEVIGYGVDTDIFTPRPKGEAKASLGLGAGTIVILFAAHQASEKRKGFQHVAAALQRCMENSGFRALVEQCKVKLLCFGYPDPEVSNLAVPAVSLGYLDRGEEICRAYSAADVFVLPSSEDNLPNTMLEAMSCATPVVAFDAGGIPDAVSDGVTGRLVPSGDVGALAEALMSLVFNPEERRALGERSRQVIQEAYALPVQAKRYLTLYTELLQDRTPPDRVSKQGSAAPISDSTDDTTVLSTMDSPVFLETGLGPHFQSIYGQVLLRALKEGVPAMHKDHEAGVERLNADIRDLRLQISGIRNSRSWRLTEPLRRLNSALRNLRR